MLGREARRMLSRLQYLVEGWFESSASTFKKAGFSPNTLTVLGFLLTLVTAGLYFERLTPGWVWLLTVFLISLGGFFDALDGAMARRYLHVSRIGGVLDSVLDRIGEIALYTGIGLGGLVDLRLCLWALSAALMVSYIRARVEVEGVKLKGVGIAERPERLLIILVSTLLLPVYGGLLTWGVGIVAVLSTVTVVERMYGAGKALKNVPTDPGV
jgi:archaetidylinositol phosphate synthase